jgi:hypothetical protein
VTTKFQISDKRGDAILLVSVEVPDGTDPALLGVFEEQFAAAVGLVGLGASYEAFGVAAPATVPQATQVTRPAPAYHEPSDPPGWGQPPVPPMQQPQSQPPAAARPSCQHGPKEYRHGTTNGRDWAFWGCVARQGDPTKCEKEWVR